MTIMVHLRHARMIQRQGGRPLCRNGIEAWCKRHSVDWAAFTGAGIPIEEFEQIQDHYAGVVASNARQEAEIDGQQ